MGYMVYIFLQNDNLNFFNTNLGVWGVGFYLPCWFSLNNSKMVKSITLAFSNIQYLFIRDIHGKCGIRNSSQSPDIGQNSGVFPISRFLFNPL